MSEFNERVISALTDEWQTTREIADLVGVAPTKRVYSTLNKEVRYKLAEKRPYKTGGVHGVQWRRISKRTEAMQ